MKNVDVAVYNYLRTVADGSVQPGISTGTLQNGGVKASDGIKDGSITIDLSQ